MQARSQSMLARYRLLVELTAVLARTHRTDDVLTTLHQRIGTLFTAPVTVLALHQPGGGWHCQTLEGRNTHHKTLPPQSDGLLERALRGQLTYTNDLTAYAEQSGSELRLRRLDPDSKLPYTLSWMGVPLELEGRLAGVLSLQSYARNDFGDDDLEFLRLLSTHLGIAMENALLRERLEVEARTDALTGLLNRRSFVYSGERAVAANLHGTQAVTLAVVDVQQFKRINDDLGHPTGDAVLAGLGHLLRQPLPGVSAADISAFRLGGDEFALLLPMILPAAHTHMERLLDALQHQQQWPITVKLNVGLAEHRPGQSFESLVHYADAHMYDAKAGGMQLAPLSSHKNSGQSVMK